MLIIDGNSLMCRSFFAMRVPLKAPDGTPTGGAFGFFKMLSTIIGKMSPDEIICAFDGGSPDFRKDITGGQYKATRKRDDDEREALNTQFRIAEEMLSSLSIPYLRIKGWEGDDVIGTVSRIAEEDGNYKTYILSSDQDMFQLVTDKTYIVAPVSGTSVVKIYDTEAVKEKLGVLPYQVPDYKGICGDSSDNIKGVAGIGPKGAVTLLSKYGNLEKISDNLDDIEGTIGNKIRAGIKDAFECRTVATICKNINLKEASCWLKVAEELRTSNDKEILNFFYFPSFKEKTVKAALQSYGFSQFSIEDFINNATNTTYYDYEDDIIENDKTQEDDENQLEFSESLF